MGFRIISLLAIVETAWVEFDWARELLHERLFALVPVAWLAPLAMLWFFLFVNIRDREGADYSPVYRALRPDIIKCVTLTACCIFLAHRGSILGW